MGIQSLCKCMYDLKKYLLRVIVYPSTHPSIPISAVCPSVGLSVCSSVCLSVRLNALILVIINARDIKFVLWGSFITYACEV